MRKLRKLIQVLLGVTAASLFIFSAGKVINYCLEAKESIDYNADLIRQVSVDEATPKGSEVSPISIDFNVLTEENADVMGWLYCPETPINYPVVQADNNEYYLCRLLNGEWNPSGSLFMDYRNSSANMDWNTVIYGHNMKNYSMFGTLHLYSDQAYYEQHPVIYFLTPEADYKIELISGFVTPADSALYNIYLPESDRTKLISDILKSSDFISDTDTSKNTRLLTLSTCSYEYDTARYVVVGKMIEIAKLNEHETN